MRRLGSKNSRTVRIPGTIPHGKSIPVQRIKPGIPIPGFIKMNAIYGLTKQFFDLSCMITEAIIRRVGDNGMDRMIAVGIRGEGTSMNFFLY